MTEQKPYLIRAIHEWIADNAMTTYLVVYTNKLTKVPEQFIKNNRIVLNISDSAVKTLEITNTEISFEAAFGGEAMNIFLPVDNIMAIFPKETGVEFGMEFPIDPQTLDRVEPKKGLKLVK